jgi:transcription elongation factor S-II
MDYPLRKKTRELLYKILTDTNQYTLENEKKMNNVEIGIFNYSLDNCGSIMKNWSDENFKNFYKNRARALLLNLNPNSYVKNDKLIYRYLKGEIQPEELSVMNHREMFPERYLEADFFNKEAIKDIMTSQEKVYDSLLQCNRCRKHMISYYEVQTRSADEPTTKFCNCTNCGFRFTFC